MKDKIHGGNIWIFYLNAKISSVERKTSSFGKRFLNFENFSKLPKFSQFLIRWRFFEGRNCHIFSLLASKLINVIIFIQMDARQSHNLKFLYLSQQQQSPSIWFAWWSHNLQCVSITQLKLQKAFEWSWVTVSLQAKRSCQACPWNWSLTTIRLITLVPPTLYWMDEVMNPWNYYAACFFSFMTHDWSWSDEDDEERYGSFVKTLVADNNDVMSVGKFSATYGSELESSFRFWAYKPQGL